MKKRINKFLVAVFIFSLVVGNNIVNASTINSNITSNAGVSYAKLSLSGKLSGDVIKTKSIRNKHLGNNAVTSNKISDGTIKGEDIKDGAVTFDKISGEDCNPNQILKYSGSAWLCVNDDGGVSNGEIDDNSVTSEKILNGTIIGADVASRAISADKLASNNCTSGQVMKYNGAAWVCADDAALTEFNTVSELRNATLVVGQYYTTSGYSTASDGGAGKYLIVAGNTADGYVNLLVNSGTATAILQHNGILDVKQAGADGTGQVDSSHSIQAAIDAVDSSAAWSGWLSVGVVNVSPGKYKISAPLVIKHPVSLIGASSDSTRLTLDANVAGSLIQVIPENDGTNRGGSPLSTITIKNMMLFGNGTASSQRAHAISFELAATNPWRTSAYVTDMIIRDFSGEAIYGNSFDGNAHIERVVIYNTTLDGIYLYNCYDWKIIDTDIGVCHRDGVSFELGGNHRITASYIYVNSQYNLHVKNSGVSMVAGMLDTAGKHAAYIDNTYDYKHVTLTDVTFGRSSTEKKDTYSDVYFPAGANKRTKLIACKFEAPYPKTEWVEAVVYAANTYVVHNGEKYKSRVGHISSDNNEPGIGNDWEAYWEIPNYNNNKHAIEFEDTNSAVEVTSPIFEYGGGYIGTLGFVSNLAQVINYQDLISMTGISTFEDGATTPSVLNYKKFLTDNTSSTSYTDFTDGVEGQEILIQSGGNTVIVNGTTVKLAGSTNATLTEGSTLSLVKRGSVWYETGRSIL